MKTTYLILAIVGAVVPYLFFLPWFAEHGIALGGFVSAAFGNQVAAGATSDLLISSAVFWVMMGADGEGRRAPWFVALNLLIGLSCALPAYLYVRERQKAAVRERPAVGLS